MKREKIDREKSSEPSQTSGWTELNASQKGQGQKTIFEDKHTTNDKVHRIQMLNLT